jgi:hypothetical protein
MTEEQKDTSYPSEEPRSFSTKGKYSFGTFVGSIPRAFLCLILISAQNIDLPLNLAELLIEQVDVI